MSKRDVSPEIKEPRKQSKKSQKKTSFFLQKNKNKIKIILKTAALCYASKKPIHNTYIITSSRCFHKKNQTQNTEPEIIDCAPPENGSKKQPELLN